MESLSDVTQLMEEKHSSGEENNEENKEKSTPYLKKLCLDKKLKLSTPNYESNIKSDISDCELHRPGKLKFLERPAHPDACILVQLASRVYHEKPNGEDLEDKKLPEDWKLLTTAYNTESAGNGYFGVAYWNPTQQQIVVAHRGTILTNIGALWTDIRGILHNKYVPQVASAITFANKIKVMVEELNQRDNVFLQLSFTGHSLGGWLAQITTLTTKYFSLENVDGNDLFVKSKKVGYHAHTVVFDSPGCEEMLSEIRGNFERRHDISPDRIIISHLDITTYLSAPNLVNTCNLHTGILYRVFIDDPPSRPFYDFGKYTLKMHSIKMIEKVFFTNEIDETQIVLDWPLVDKGITKRALQILTKQVPNLLRRVLFKLIGGQPLPVNNEYDYFHLLAKEIGLDNYNPEADDCNGYCEIRYQVQKVDKTTCRMNIFSKPELDFLNKYKRLCENRGKQWKNVFIPLGDEAKKIKDALKHCKSEENIEIIRCNSEVELKRLISYVKYAIRFIPQITKRIERTLENEPIWFEIKKSVEPFIGRAKQLGWTHSNINRAMVVITGLDGVGKSELTIKYVRKHYDENNSVVWIDAENEVTIKKSFKSLYKELELIGLNMDEEEDTRLVVKRVYEYLIANSKKIIFIFDNAENYAAIEKFLPLSLPRFKKVYVVVTSSNSLEWKPDREIVEPLTLEDFHDEEAIQFVKKYLNISHEDKSHDADIKNLIQMLCKLPIALKHAVSHINMMIDEHKGRKSNYEIIKECLYMWRRQPRKMLTYRSRSGDSNNVVLPHFNNIMNKIKADENFGRQALYMLDIISYFAPSNIPEQIFLKELAEDKKKDLISITLQLQKYSIINVERGMLNVHGLVQQSRKCKVEEDEREEETLKRALLLITEHTAVCGHNQHETDREKMERDKKECEKKELYAPHIVSVWNHAYKYMNLIEQFLLGGRQIKIPGSDIEYSVMYFHFHFIAAGNKFEIVKEIIEKIEKIFPLDGKKVQDFINARNNDEECALHCAAENGQEQTVKLLVSKGADVNAEKKYGWTPLSLAVNNGHLSIAKYLIEHGAKLGICRTSREYTELHLASKNGYLEMVKLLLKKGAGINVPYVNARDNRRHTPLHFAVKKNHLEIIKVLLEDGRIDVNAETESKRTPLHFAVKTGNVESVEVLLNKGANINAKESSNDVTSLHVAVLGGKEIIVRCLLERNEIEIDAQTTEGNTALHLAAEKGNLGVVEILIQKKADASIINNDGQLASELADKNGLAEVKNYIVENSKLSNEPYNQAEQDC